ncbi:hypothetical protein [Halomonas llamarensis]|uniref:DUF4760 domain-containing protein n=1 Tax=Halomonas llamarensis TaxID=2945104 RepID=A0ABT0SUD3_9GAMM|nr:hypothetical protein [Halomonas llamarensis]MCL7931351.1 hypothetical protein [Halomonas llamarensis]
MDSNLASALIAATVSLIVSLVTLWATRYKAETDKERQERELERKLTERLYEKRIEAYPKAFSITQNLLSSIKENDGLKQEELTKVYHAISEWASNDASFILSLRSLNAYYRLREAILVEPDEDGKYTREQREHIWKAKNKLRGSLRDDVHLLFLEDQK